MTLARAARAKGLRYGAAIMRVDMEGDSDYRTAIENYCDIVVPENELKWAGLRPSSGTWAFANADWVIRWARSKNKLVRGHTLIWGDALPSWASSYLDSATASQGVAFLREHILTVMKRYAGKIYSWDVVNEAISPWDMEANYMRANKWFSTIGYDYVRLAFEAAREADPNCELVLNQNYCEYEDSPVWDNFREGTLALLDALNAEQQLVDAVGLQGHLSAAQTFSASAFAAFLQELANRNVAIHITELDVKDNEHPVNITTRDNEIAAIYQEFLAVCLEQSAVKQVITWGLSDKYTWIADSQPRPDGEPVRPLPLDLNMAEKKAYDAMIAEFIRAPIRSGALVRPDEWAIDERSILRNGARFLPLGMYYLDYTLTVANARNTLRSIRAAGGNCAIITLSLAEEEIADYAAQIGLNLWIEANDVAGSAAVAAHYANHPAVAGFMIFDDVNTFSVAELQSERDSLLAAAPNKLMMGSGDYQIENVYTALPIPAVQVYPISMPAESMIAMAATYAATVFDAIAAAEKPLIFNAQTYKSGSRWPTENELRNMVWQAFIRGATGLITYSAYGNDATEEDFFNESGLVTELTSLFGELDSKKVGILNGSRVRATTGSAYSEIAYFELDTEYLVVALNSSDLSDPPDTAVDNLSVSLALPADATGTIAQLHARYADVLTRSGTTFSGTLDAEEVAAYTVQKA